MRTNDPPGDLRRRLLELLADGKEHRLCILMQELHKWVHAEYACRVFARHRKRLPDCPFAKVNKAKEHYVWRLARRLARRGRLRVEGKGINRTLQLVKTGETPVSDPGLTLNARLIQIDRIDCHERHRKDMGDIDALAASIRAVGLLQPIIVRSAGPRYRLIAGERRLYAVRKIDGSPLATIEAYVVDRLTDAASLLRAERDENTCRKDFTPTEAVAVGRALEELEAKRAKQRQGVPARDVPENYRNVLRGTPATRWARPWA
jgi:hypothetical protein